MKQYLLLFFAVSLSVQVVGQQSDSLFVREAQEGSWYARYRVRAGEQSVFSIAKKFGLPPARLADANSITYADKLVPDMLLKIPLGKANWYNYTPPAGAATRPLYYRLNSESELKDVAQKLGVPKKQLQDWNPGITDRPKAGRVLAVGWISMGSTIGKPAEEKPTVVVPARPAITEPVTDDPNTDTITAVVPVRTPIEQQFLDQTFNGTSMTTEKGPAAFFPGSGRASNGVHYAFHNGAMRGAIVRVYNPGTGRSVYVKVIGPLPATKQYAGALIGISASAKAALGVRESRAWCEVSY